MPATRTRSRRRPDPTPEQVAAWAAEDTAVHTRSNDLLASPDLADRIGRLLNGTTSRHLLGDFSLRNLLLLQEQAEQRGSPLTDVATAGQWRPQGRHVRAGTHGLRAIRTRGFHTPASGGAKRRTFALYTVHLLCDTAVIDGAHPEPTELPDPAAAAQTLWDNLVARLDHTGHLLARPAGSGLPAGSVDHTSGVICVRADLDTNQPATVIVLACQIAAALNHADVNTEESPTPGGTASP